MTRCFYLAARAVICLGLYHNRYSLGWSVFGATGSLRGCWPGYRERAVMYDWPGHRENGWECR